MPETANNLSAVSSSACHQAAREAALPSLVKDGAPLETRIPAFPHRANGPHVRALTLSGAIAFTAALQGPHRPNLPVLLARALQRRAARFFSQLKDCREEASKHAVHETRVAARRLLAQFALLESISHQAPLDKAKEKLKRLVSALGELRDVQVQKEYFRAWAPRFPELEPLLQALNKRERRLQKPAAEAVQRFRAKKLKEWLEAAHDELICAGDSALLCRLLKRQALNRASEAFREVELRAAAVHNQDAEAVHRTRISFKRFRYIMESLSPHVTGLERRDLQPLARLQRQMGRIQDLAVAEQWLLWAHRKKGTRAACSPRVIKSLAARREEQFQVFYRDIERLRQFRPGPRG